MPEEEEDSDSGGDVERVTKVEEEVDPFYSSIYHQYKGKMIFYLIFFSLIKQRFSN